MWHDCVAHDDMLYVYLLLMSNPWASVTLRGVTRRLFRCLIGCLFGHTRRCPRVSGNRDYCACSFFVEVPLHINKCSRVFPSSGTQIETLPTFRAVRCTCKHRRRVSHDVSIGSRRLLQALPMSGVGVPEPRWTRYRLEWLRTVGNYTHSDFIHISFRLFDTC